MKQKLLFFFLTAFLSLIGGGNLFAADETFSVTGNTESSPQTINGTNWDSEDVTLSSATASVALTIGRGSSYWTLDSDKITGNNNSASLTFLANKNGLLVINITKNSGGNKRLTIKSGGSGQQVKSVIANGSTMNYDDNNHNYNINVANNTTCPIVVSIDAEAGTSYTIDFSASNFKDWSFSSFTFDLETIDNIYSDTYPYTWQFNVEAAKWTKSISQITANTTDWVVMSSGNEARNKVTTAITVNDIDICKGLTFQANVASADASSTLGGICLDWSNRQLWMNGKLTIPALKVGMKVTFTSNDNVTATEESTGRVSGSGKEFTVTTAGNVTFSVGTHVQAIAVTKNDLTDFSFDLGQTYYGKSTPSSGKIAGAFIGRTNTFKYKLGRDQILRTTMRVDPDAQTLVGKSLAADENIPEFTKSSSNESVLGTSGTACRSAANRVTYWDIPVMGCGTTNLTYSFAGSDAYNAEDYVQMITIEKDDPVLAFASDFITKNQGDAAFTNALKLNGLSLPFTDDRAGEVNATYESKNTSVATVDGTGKVTIVAPGVAIIEATVAESAYNNKVEKTYKLIVNPTSGTDPVLSWNGDVSNVSVQYNQNVTRTATGTVGDGQTIKYRSADTSVASVDATGIVTGTGVGSTTIYAYVEPTSTHNYAEISYSVTVTSAGELESFRFIPNNGKVNKGKSITPKLAFPTIPASGVTSLKVTQIQVLERNGAAVSDAALTTNEAIAGCDIISIDEASDLRNNWVLNADGKVHKVNVTINGKAVGKAEITVTFTSTYYSTATATYTIEVTDASTRNFSWADESGSPEYYTYAGDFMMLPAITGNSNGNNNYSNGAKNSASYSEGGTSYSALQKYKYEIKNGKITWNNKDIKIGEGFPDFEIVTDGISSPGVAAVFFGRGEGSSHPDTIMVYCETAGDVKLRAYDPQDHTKYCDATIHILPINDIEGSNGAATNVTGSMTYPYTWDFTTNFDMSVVGETDRYWTSIKDSSGDPTGDYTNGYGFFNLDWADTNNNNNTGDRIYKYFIAGAGSSATGYMHEFNGMMLKLKGSTSWANKRDRMRILAYDNTNQKGRLQFNGGPHYMKLYLPVAANRPSSFKIFVKAEGSGSVNINENENTKQNLSATAQIYSFDSSDITTTGDNCVILGFENARVYWIAMSTEAKAVNKPTDKNPNLNYAASSYAYNKALDLSKSEEANEGLEVYYASGFKKGSNASASPGSAGSAVVLTQMTTDGKPVVEANTGLILKAANAFNSYMIAHAQNAKSPVTPSVFTGEGAATNYLVAGPGETVNSSVDTGNGIKTNFVISYAYKQFTEDGSVVSPDYLYDRDWSFYKIIPSADVPSSSAYLSIPGNLYVNKDGQIVERATSARAAFGVESAADDDTAEAPASKLMLDIIFQETSDTATDDPATEDPETPLPPDVINGIDNVKTDEADSAVWHSMEGVRISQPTKPGLYIRNGKKVVIK